MYYDITNPDASYYWLHELLQMQSGEFIEEYIINCHNDFEEFFEKYMDYRNQNGMLASEYIKQYIDCLTEGDKE